MQRRNLTWVCLGAKRDELISPGWAEGLWCAEGFQQELGTSLNPGWAQSSQHSLTVLLYFWRVSSSHFPLQDLLWNRVRNPSWKQQIWRQMIIFALCWDLKSHMGSSGSPSFPKYQEHFKTPAMKMFFTLKWLNLDVSYEHRFIHFLVLAKPFSL